MIKLAATLQNDPRGLLAAEDVLDRRTDAGGQSTPIITPRPGPALCFAAGTRVHTIHGTKAIEDIRVGDMVLSQPEAGGEPVFKPVTDTSAFDEGAVLLLTVRGVGEGGRKQKLLVTANHLFRVTGYDPDSIDPDYIDLYMARLGWRRADELDHGALLDLADGGSACVRSVEQLWRTKTEGVGWVAVDPDSDSGWCVDMRDGRIVEHLSDPVMNDFAASIDFRARYETEELGWEWAYKCKVYNIEVEDFHTCYVGELGVCARDASAVAGLRESD